MNEEWQVQQRTYSVTIGPLSWSLFEKRNRCLFPGAAGPETYFVHMHLFKYESCRD